MNFANFIGGSYPSQAITADNERSVNCYVERIEPPGATARQALLPTPGFEQLVATTSAGGRAHFFVNGREFMIVGTSLVEADEDAALTFHQTLSMDSNPATISSNGDGGDEIFVTSGGNAWTMDLTSGVVTQITALNGSATQGDQLDGYFLALDANTGTFYSSELLDGLTWTTGTMFAERNAAPDVWISMKVSGRYIILWGAQTGEVWYDAGSAPFPFSKHPSGDLQWGIAAPWSAAVCDSSVLWLGASRGGAGAVLRMDGFTPEVVSTYAVQNDIDRYMATGTIADAYADTYHEAGHTFYVLSFPTADKTWVYDLQMQSWHERGNWDPSTSGIDPGTGALTTGIGSNASDFSIWLPRCHAFAFGEHRWLHGTSTGLYRMAATLGTDIGGVPIRRLRRSPILQKENARISYPGLELDIEPGLGLVSGQGSNPQVMMRTSKDGGKTWSRERWRSAGKIGEYGQRLRWNRLGAARRMVIEISFTDPTPFRVTGAYLTPAPVVLGAQQGAA